MMHIYFKCLAHIPEAMAGANSSMASVAEKRRLREVESALEEVRKKIRVLRSEQASLEDEKKTLEQIIKSQVIIKAQR